MWRNSVEPRCRLCTGDLLPFIFLLFRKFFSDWHSVIWYIYGDFCADRCIVFIVTFLYWIWSPVACNGGGGGCFFVFVCLMGALGESILQRDLPRRRLSWKDNDVPRLLPFHYVKRESRAIRISACYDKSGSSEKKKKCSFIVLWGCHWAFGSFFRLAVLLWFRSSFWGWEMGREAWGGSGRGLCNYKVLSRFL